MCVSKDASLYYRKPTAPLFKGTVIPRAGNLPVGNQKQAEQRVSSLIRRKIIKLRKGTISPGFQVRVNWSHIRYSCRRP